MSHTRQVGYLTSVFSCGCRKMADQKQLIANIPEDRNQARRERDRARRNSLTAEQKEEINARQRAARQNKALDERNAQQRASRQNISTKERRENNARRRTARQSITGGERAALLAQRKANAATRRNTPCAESIAMPCPNATTLPTIHQILRRHKSTAKEGTASPPGSPSTSMPEYTVRTDGTTPIFTPFIYVMPHLSILLTRLRML